MRTSSLRPHTFHSSAEHSRHPAWRNNFSPRERHQLIDEDHDARMHVFKIIAGILMTGLVLGSVVIWLL